MSYNTEQYEAEVRFSTDENEEDLNDKSSSVRNFTQFQIIKSF
jgi:hypothetical protein